MEYTALIEPIEDRYRAVALAPFDVVAFGITETEALERLDFQIRERVLRGARILHRQVAIPEDNPESQEHPLARFAGDLANDPLAEGWSATMKSYREEAEKNPDY